MTGRFGQRLMAGLVVLLVTSGCAEEIVAPTASQAGEKLRVHVTKLLEAVGSSDVKIVDAGGRNISCGNNTVKRTFLASASNSAPELGPDGLNAILAAALKGIAEYKVVDDGKSAHIRLYRKEDRTTLILQSPSDGKYQVWGETDCLSLS